MNIHTIPKMTIEEFFSWAHEQQAKGENTRCELVGGLVKMQPNVRLNHTVITNNIVHELLKQIDRDKYLVANGDFAVQTGPNSIRYPDIMIMPAGKDGNILSVDDAIILFEVLSKSTMHKDFGEKKQEYQALETLQTYVVLAQDEPMIWAWLRDEDGEWHDEPQQISEGKLALKSVGVRLSVEELYLSVR